MLFFFLNLYSSFDVLIYPCRGASSNDFSFIEIAGIYAVFSTLVRMFTHLLMSSGEHNVSFFMTLVVALDSLCLVTVKFAICDLARDQNG